MQRLGRFAQRERSGMRNYINYINVIASGAKQSILSLRGEMDCFAEPVIGRAFARPVGSSQ